MITRAGSFSGSLVRTGSAMLTGGAALGAALDGEAGEAASPGGAGGAGGGSASGGGGGGGEGVDPLLRTASTRRQSDGQAVQQRLREAAMENIRNNLAGWIKLILPMALAVVVVTIVTLVFFIRAFLAMSSYNDNSAVPCDQPLHDYLCVALFVGYLSNSARKHTSAIASKLCSPGFSQHLLAYVLSCFPGWCAIAWGVSMLEKVKTCPHTNPSLYYPTRAYIIWQIILAVFMFVVVLFIFAFWSRLMLAMSTLNESTGCVEGVKKLPIIPSGSEELMDPEDEQPKDCCICMQSFGGPKAVLRTRCNHFFHEECLIQWAASHMDCPLCREAMVDIEENL